jgi:hypothetical protein
MKPVAEIMDEMLREYRRHSRGWRMLKSVDSRGFINLFFSGAGKLWLIKGEPKSPYELVGAGARLAEKVDERIKKSMDKGEPLPFWLATVHPEEEAMIVASGIGRGSESSPLSLLSKEQREMDEKLRKKLEELCEKYGLREGFG